MYQDKVVLCASSKYEQKYYLNDDFAGLPDRVKKELQIMCVLFTEEIGGILTLQFTENGELEFETVSKEDDFLYDDIGSVLKIKQLRADKKELFESLEMYYKVFFLGEEGSDAE